MGLRAGTEDIEFKGSLLLGDTSELGFLRLESCVTNPCLLR